MDTFRHRYNPKPHFTTSYIEGGLKSKDITAKDYSAETILPNELLIIHL